MPKDKIPASPVYGYLRQWFDFAFEHQGMVTGNHTAIYCWFIEQNNRLGWAKEFGAPRDQTMAAAGISSYNTYKKCFNDLINWGFVKLVKPSRNQYFANVIALSKFDKAKYKALDKALLQHLTKQSESILQSTVALTIPLNNETTIPLNHIGPPAHDEVFIFFKEKKQKESEAEKFFKKYTGLGWKINGSPIEHWQSIAEIWISNIGKFSPENSKNKKNNQSPPTPTKQPFGSW